MVEALTDYLEGALVPVERGRVAAHLGACSGCATYLEQLFLVIRAARTLPDEPDAPSLRETLTLARLKWDSDPRDGWGNRTERPHRSAGPRTRRNSSIRSDRKLVVGAEDTKDAVA